MATINSDVMDAIYGMRQPGSGGRPAGPEYVSAEKRGAMSRIVLNTGTYYLLGASAGGLYGAVQGFRDTKSRIMKIRLNGTFNGIEKNVSKYGNGVGVLALSYSIIDSLGTNIGIPQYLPSEYAEDLMPILSATLTGLLFKSTASPKQAIISGVIGGSIMGIYQAAQEYLPRDLTSRFRLF